jgi:mannitol/fructose-specific phosphotransferase system IIA component (Ntr-type)
MHIIKEKGLRKGDPFDETITKARIIHINKEIDFNELINRAAEFFSLEKNISKGALIEEFLSTSAIDPMLVSLEVSIMYGKHQGIDNPSMQIFLSPSGIKEQFKRGITDESIKIIFFLLNTSEEPRQQLRMLSRIIDIVERENFCGEMLKLKSEREIKEYLLHNERFITVWLDPDNPQPEFVNKQLKDIKLPANVLVALIERGSETFTPNGNTTLLENDVLTIIGEPKSISQLFDKIISGKIK